MKFLYYFFYSFTMTFLYIFFSFWHLNFLCFLLFLENASFLTRNCDLLALLQCYSCIFDTTNMLDTLPAMHEHSFLLLILAACGWLYVSYWIPFSLFNIQLFLSLFAIFLFSSFFFTFSFYPRTFLSFLPSVLPCVAWYTLRTFSYGWTSNIALLQQ